MTSDKFGMTPISRLNGNQTVRFTIPDRVLPRTSGSTKRTLTARLHLAILLRSADVHTAVYASAITPDIIVIALTQRLFFQGLTENCTMSAIVIEACVDSVAGAIAAQTGGAQRVELCAGLSEGGLTPSAATIEYPRQRTRIGLNVMIRPRGGDFCYSDLEFEVMLKDVAVAKSLGADGVVFGILDPDGAIDEARVARFVAAARPLPVTFPPRL